LRFRVDQAPDKNFWFIIEDSSVRNEGKLTLNSVFSDTLIIEELVVRVDSVFVESPTQLAAFSQALMLLNGVK
jgi:hypothetical protein